ncbi:hypothetical protein Ahy_B05g073915 [Arachis hypogaea]|uniref:Uncharacterized protein n=1 Tax=Arachis hypogaea TaxID=3818 RepID=A0A444YXC9_ARAHY|nr:hypothetical protein Ahy_B05g073915 [Arachis hypogaea]
MAAVIAAVTAAYGGTILLVRPVSANDHGGGGSHLAAIRQKIHDPSTTVPSREVQRLSGPVQLTPSMFSSLVGAPRVQAWHWMP